MLYYLFNYLDQLDFPGAGMFKYVSFRSGLALILSLFISTAIGRQIIDQVATCCRSARRCVISAWKGRM